MVLFSAVAITPRRDAGPLFFGNSPGKLPESNRLGHEFTGEVLS
jgi:hypothetical protein